MVRFYLIFWIWEVLIAINHILTIGNIDFSLLIQIILLIRMVQIWIFVCLAGVNIAVARSWTRLGDFLVVRGASAQTRPLWDNSLIWSLRVVSLTRHVSITLRVTIIIFINLLRHVPFWKLGWVNGSVYFDTGVKFMTCCFHRLLFLGISGTYPWVILLLLIIIIYVLLHLRHTFTCFQRLWMHL